MLGESSLPTNSTEPLPRNISTLKRPASLSLELHEDDTRKRIKAQADHNPESWTALDSNEMVAISTNEDADILAKELAQELQCACCSELVYRPVVVSPCQHFFCGSCCVLWVKNGGTNCPSCRGVSTAVTHSRPLQAIVDVLLRAVPSKARTDRERAQADEVYKVGTSLRIPTPRETSPDPSIYQSSDFARPCPYCTPGNPYGWTCSDPIVDPDRDPDNAWRWEAGIPPGHAHCGNCENLLAILAPSTTKCDFCQVPFCGIGIQGRCSAAPVLSQHPNGMDDISDLIQSTDVYECFDSNTVEVEIMLDYLTTQRLTPRHIYREIITHIQSQPRAFAPLIELELFTNENTIPDPNVPCTRVCRMCATEIFLWGLREWWVRERQKGFLDETVMNRKDCADGTGCGRQSWLAHAREFNHIIVPRTSESEMVPQPEPQSTVLTDSTTTPSNRMEDPPISPTTTAVVEATVATTQSSHLPSGS